MLTHTVIVAGMSQGGKLFQGIHAVSSDVILDGISKGIISSAIALDMDEIGRYSVNALEEFSSLGHTSNYYSVGQHVITRSNVGTYRTEGD